MAAFEGDSYEPDADDVPTLAERVASLDVARQLGELDPGDLRRLDQLTVRLNARAASEREGRDD